MRDAYARFQQAGALVLLVSMGSAQEAADFRTRFALPYPCLADPERRAYQAFNLPRAGPAALLGPRMWSQGLKSLWRHGVGKIIGDPYQLGGTFVIDRQGTVRHVHRSINSADNATTEELLQALAALPPVAAKQPS